MKLTMPPPTHFPVFDSGISIYIYSLYKSISTPAWEEIILRVIWPRRLTPESLLLPKGTHVHATLRSKALKGVKNWRKRLSIEKLAASCSLSCLFYSMKTCLGNVHTEEKMYVRFISTPLKSQFTKEGANCACASDLTVWGGQAWLWPFCPALACGWSGISQHLRTQTSPKELFGFFKIRNQASLQEKLQGDQVIEGPPPPTLHKNFWWPWENPKLPGW